MADDLIRPLTGPLRAPGTGVLPAASAEPAVATAVAPAPAAAPTPAAAPADTAVLGGGTGPLSASPTQLALGQPVTAVVPQAAAPGGPAPMDRIQDQTEAVEDARAAVTELESELAEAMTRLGPALGEDQQQQFLDTFKAQHQATYDALAAAEAELAGTLAANQEAIAAAYLAEPSAFDSMLDMAFDSDRDIALEAYKALGPAHAQTVTDFAARVLSDPEAARQGLGDTIVTELVQPNMAALVGAAVAQQGEGQAPAQVAIDAVQAQLGAALGAYLANAGDLGTTIGGTASEALANVRDLRDSLSDLSQVFKSDPSHFSANLAQYAQDWSQKSPLGRVMASAGLVAGALACGEAMDAGLAAAIGTYANTAKGACELLLGMKAVTTALGPQASVLCARAVPLLGAVTSAANAWDLAQQGDMMSLGAAGGEAAAALGGLMVAFGVGTGGAGPALIAVGSLASMGFRGMAEYGQQLGLDAEYRAILTDPNGMNLDPAVVDPIMQFLPGGLERLGQAYGIPPEQLPALLQEPGMSDLLDLPIPLGGMQDPTNSPYLQFLNQAFGRPDGTLDGPAFIAFVRAQRDAAAGLPGADAFAYTAAMFNDRSGVVYNPRDAAEWAAAFDGYEAALDAAGHLSAEDRALAKAHLQVMRDQVAG